ncbi:MAG TPA: hypothetical protein VJW76_07530 [Verrucomicrobiae bacterium]|nr:hypothetical protein [Verrucomicrobiae bacterium]
MRAGPLSNSKVISLLNRYFVPVYATNEDYRENGAAPREEKAEYNRVFKESHAAKLSTGTVHVYILNPEGHPIDSLHVASASKTGHLVEVLEGAIRKLGAREGQAVVPPAAQCARPSCEAGSLTFHLTARSLDGRGAWSEFPVENWIVLGQNEWKKLLPTLEVRAGAAWEVDRDVANRFLTHFYPATENNDVSKNHLEQISLKATVVSIEGGVARARLDGELRMRHSFYHKEDGKIVEATVVGFMDFDSKRPALRSLNLVTDKATYGGGSFGIAMRLTD